MRSHTISQLKLLLRQKIAAIADQNEGRVPERQYSDSVTAGEKAGQPDDRNDSLDFCSWSLLEKKTGHGGFENRLKARTGKQEKNDVNTVASQHGTQ